MENRVWVGRDRGRWSERGAEMKVQDISCQRAKGVTSPFLLAVGNSLCSGVPEWTGQTEAKSGFFDVYGIFCSIQVVKGCGWGNSVDKEGIKIQFRLSKLSK